MPKPIFIIRAPKDLAEHIERMYSYINNTIAEDYHVLIVADSPDEQFRFHCFNSDLDEIDLETLKELVLAGVTKAQNETI